MLFFFQNNTATAGGKGKKKKEIDPNLLQARVIRQTRNIPNLVAKLETFMGDLQKLASKSKSNKLLEGIKLGTVRDFRIKLDQAPQPPPEAAAAQEDATNVASDAEVGNYDINQLSVHAIAWPTQPGHPYVRSNVKGR